MNFAAKVWGDLSSINVNNHTEKKGNLTYLSWSWAWATLMQEYPDSRYEFREPVFFQNGTCEVWCQVTVSDGTNELKRDMWLPVMDYKNKAIVNPDSMAINTARMRCLTKCLALFGLGHYIYAGEDVPQGKEEPQTHDEYGRKKYTEQELAKTISKLDQYIDGILTGIEKDDPAAVVELWRELDEEQQTVVWKHQLNTKQKQYVREATKVVS